MDEGSNQDMENTAQHMTTFEQQEVIQSQDQKQAQQPLKQSCGSTTKRFQPNNHFQGRHLLYEVKESRELTEEEKKECTFNPQINIYELNIEREGRTVEERLQLQGRDYERNKEAARRKKELAIIEQQREQEQRLREKIAKSHKNDAANGDDEPIENKILKRSGMALQNHKIPNDSFSEFTFMPQINKMTPQLQDKLKQLREGKSATEWMYEKGKQNVSKLRANQNDETIILRGKDAEDVYREIMGDKLQNQHYKLAEHFTKRQKEMEQRRAATHEEEQKRFQQETQQYKSTGISSKLQAEFDRLKQEAQENRARALEAQQKAEQAKRESLMCEGSIQLTKSGTVSKNRGEILYNRWKNEIKQQKESNVAKAVEVEKQLQEQSILMKKEYQRPQFTENSTGYHQRIKELDRAKNQYKLKQQLREQKEQEENMKQQLEEQRMKKIDRYLEQQKKAANQSIEQLGESAKNARKLDTMINGTKRFLDNQRLAASNKEYIDRRLNQTLPPWHIEPTRTIKTYKIAEPKRPKEISEEVIVTPNMEHFFNMATSELKNGINADNTTVQPQKIVQTTTSVLDIAAIGERQKIPTVGGIFTKFHKIASLVQAQNFDRADYIKRRIQRDQEVQLLSQSLTNSNTFQSTNIGDKSIRMYAD